MVAELCYHYNFSKDEILAMSPEEAMAFLIYLRHIKATEALDALTIADFPSLNAAERKKIVKHIKSLMLPNGSGKLGNSKSGKLSNKDLFELLAGKRG